jgi:hypothetical protein
LTAQKPIDQAQMSTFLLQWWIPCTWRAIWHNSQTSHLTRLSFSFLCFGHGCLLFITFIYIHQKYINSILVKVFLNWLHFLSWFFWMTCRYHVFSHTIRLWAIKISSLRVFAFLFQTNFFWDRVSKNI